MEKITITFKNGESVTYEKGEWDDYRYDGKSITVKLKGVGIALYNLDCVFCVELK